MLLPTQDQARRWCHPALWPRGKKKTFEEQFVHLLPNSNAHKKCCSARFSHNSWKTVLPASAHYKLHFHSIPSFINVCKMLRNNFKADRTIFRQMFSLKKHRPSWTVIYLSVLWSGRVHIIAHLWGFILSRRPRFLWIFVLVMIRLQPFPHQCSLGAALKPLPTPGQLMTDLGSKGMQ